MEQEEDLLLQDVQGGRFVGVGASQAQLNKPFVAKLLAYDGDMYYSWIEQQLSVAPAGATPTWTANYSDLPGGRAGEIDQNPAFEGNGAVLSPPTYVKLRRAYYDPVLDWVYLIDMKTQGVDAVYLVGSAPNADGVWDAVALRIDLTTKPPKVLKEKKIWVFDITSVTPVAGP